MALGNRGPFRRDADGRVARDIIEAYKRTGFYVLESLVSQEELRELQDEFETLLDNAPVREDDGVNVAFVQRQKDHGEEFEDFNYFLESPDANGAAKEVPDRPDEIGPSADPRLDAKGTDRDSCGAQP